MNAFSWEENGTSNKEYRFVDRSGRIAGIVSGNPYSEDDTWHAHIERVDEPHVQLGRYTTEDLAKKAIQVWWSSATDK
jgi:hypothetical protein